MEAGLTLSRDFKINRTIMGYRVDFLYHKLPHRLITFIFERTRRGEMWVEKSAGLPVGNSKIYLLTGRLLSFSPKGAVLSPI